VNVVAISASRNPWSARKDFKYILKRGHIQYIVQHCYVEKLHLSCAEGWENTIPACLY
jgi:hypothetical protein